MSDKTECPDCGDKHTCLQCIFDNIGDTSCNGTGEVEPFWTRKAPSDDGYYWAILWDDIEIIKTEWRDGGLYWLRPGAPFSFDLQLWQKSIKYWSCEPIQFPDPPKD